MLNNAVNGKTSRNNGNLSGFIKLFPEIFSEAVLPLTYFDILIILAYKVFENLETHVAFPTIEAIHRYTRISEERIRKSINYLVNCGIFKHDDTQCARANSYIICEHVIYGWDSPMSNDNTDCKLLNNSFWTSNVLKTPEEIALYIFFKTKMYGQETFLNITQPEISQHTGIALRTAKKYLKILKDKGVISFEVEDGKRSNVYTIHPEVVNDVYVNGNDVSNNRLDYSQSFRTYSERTSKVENYKCKINSQIPGNQSNEDDIIMQLVNYCIENGRDIKEVIGRIIEMYNGACMERLQVIMKAFPNIISNPQELELLKQLIPNITMNF